MLDWLVSPVVSGLLGTVGGFANKWLDLKAIDKQNAHELNMLNAKTQATVTVAKMSIQEAEIAGKLRVDEQEAVAFTESQKTRSDLGELLKSAVRPFILLATGYLCYENLTAIELMMTKADILPASELIELYSTSVKTVFSLFSMGTGWYFGQRTSKMTDAFLRIRSNKKAAQTNGTTA